MSGLLPAVFWFHVLFSHMAGSPPNAWSEPNGIRIKWDGTLLHNEGVPLHCAFYPYKTWFAFPSGGDLEPGKAAVGCVIDDDGAAVSVG